MRAKSLAIFWTTAVLTGAGVWSIHNTQVEEREVSRCSIARVNWGPLLGELGTAAGAMCATARGAAAATAAATRSSTFSHPAPLPIVSTPTEAAQRCYSR